MFLRVFASGGRPSGNLEHQNDMKVIAKVRLSRTDTESSASSPRFRTRFTLVETLTALLILTFGLLATGQLIFIAMSSTSLARSKGSAILAAQSKLEFLAGLYRQNPTAADLAIGTHGPEQVESTNPVTHSGLNRYDVVWSVALVPDPRPGKDPQGQAGNGHGHAHRFRTMPLTTRLL